MTPSVVNASPLIFLSKAGYLSLLQLSTDTVIVPAVVADEIRRGGPGDETAKALEETDWLMIKEVGEVSQVIWEWDLGDGESAALQWAYVHERSEIIIDDLLARRCAEALDIPVRGTLGLVLLAKKRGVVTRARPVVETLRETGMYLSEAVVDRALAMVGE